ncbi:alcohol dehydrogenase zinc-binding domain protein [Rhizoctonia solani]|uniref:Alcohol dehydrogenase zinc-binding domain protein n=1 Tax=Rhizoctonia solani TaxID=456999 RepID=A0A8H8NTU9_9AGAM|nr:alcohol dehydrogenase zinc-binding domain protein [Rhizoctonia solani]QRW19921.1 alcohol dehydrogenase zinc-binding domain protein [Rhizoctonia solani]
MSAIPTTAQAWRFPFDQSTWNGHKSLELREVKIAPPKQGEVLVRLYAAALSYRTFLSARVCTPDRTPLVPMDKDSFRRATKKGGRVHSLYETWFEGPVRDKYIPLTVGSGTSGCLAQYRVFDAKTLLPIPPHLSYEEASTIACAAVTAWHSFFEKRPITKDSTVLVLGSGGVSVFGAQLAKAAGDASDRHDLKQGKGSQV